MDIDFKNIDIRDAIKDPEIACSVVLHLYRSVCDDYEIEYYRRCNVVPTSAIIMEFHTFSSNHGIWEFTEDTALDVVNYIDSIVGGFDRERGFEFFKTQYSFVVSYFWSFALYKIAMKKFHENKIWEDETPIEMSFLKDIESDYLRRASSTFYHLMVSSFDEGEFGGKRVHSVREAFSMHFPPEVMEHADDIFKSAENGIER